MDRNLARPGTEEEVERAQDIALAMVDAMPLDITAPAQRFTARSAVTLCDPQFVTLNRVL